MSKFFEAASKLNPGLVQKVLSGQPAPAPEARPEMVSTLVEEAPPAKAPAAPPAWKAAPAPAFAARIHAAKSDAIQYAAEFSLNDRTSSAVLPFQGEAEASERYRILRTKILQHPKSPQVVCVSSPTTGDGKSVTAINIAGVLGLKENTRVLLLDCDFRHPSVNAMVRLPQGMGGLAEVLTGKIGWPEALLRCRELPNFYLATTGQAYGHSAELLDSNAWRVAIEHLRTQFDFIIMDSPPIGLVADYDLIQASCDGIVIVARPNHTERAALNKAMQTIPEDKNLGVVLNCVERWFLWKAQDYTYAYRDRVDGAVAREHKA